MFFDQFERNPCHSSISDIRDKKLSGSEFKNGRLHFENGRLHFENGRLHFEKWPPAFR
jgi:hypothetical protein